MLKECADSFAPFITAIINYWVAIYGNPVKKCVGFLRFFFPVAENGKAAQYDLSCLRPGKYSPCALSIFGSFLGTVEYLTTYNGGEVDVTRMAIYWLLNKRIESPFHRQHRW